MWYRPELQHGILKRHGMVGSVIMPMDGCSKGPEKYKWLESWFSIRVPIFETKLDDILRFEIAS